LEPLKPKTPDPLLGKLFGGCRIERLIGKGGMGAVYLATQLNLDRRVAIKVIAPDILDDEESLQRLSREAKIVANLSHPNIVQLHFTGKEYNFPYLVMEFVDGQSLGAVLRIIGRATVAASCDVILQVSMALEAAAAVGVVHRDIKPDNILIAPDGHVKVTDFGLARRSTDRARLTLTGQSLGTPHYMSPEQAEGQSMDIRSDLYSLGITFWQCLAGFLPFDGETPFAILMKQVHEKLPDIRVVNPEVPKEVADIITRMTVKDPGQRAASPAEVVQLLKAYLVRPDVKREKLKALGGASPAGSVAVEDASPPFGADPESIGEQAQMAYLDTLNLHGGPQATPAAATEQAKRPAAPAPPTVIKTGRRKFIVAAAAGLAVAGAGLGALILGRSSARFPATMEFVPKGTIIGHTNAVKSVQFGQNGETLVSGGADKTVRIWKESNGLQTHLLSGHAKMVTAVAVSPDGDTIASASLDNTVRLWDAEKGTDLGTLKGQHTNTVTCLSFSPDGDQLASGSMDKSVVLWDWRNRRHKKNLTGHTNMVTCLEFKNDGQLLASAGADRRVILWTTGDYRDFRTLYPHSAMVTALAFSPDGQYLATASQDHTIQLISTANNAVMKTLAGHEKSVLGVDFTLDGRYLASGSADGTVRLWNADNGREAAMVQTDSMVWAVAFNPKGLFLAAATQEGKILSFELRKLTIK
jgi:tRNA A-37 threonylcarbamoyl transferase component Bud32